MGRRIGAYRLGGILGQGRYATCFSATSDAFPGEALVVKKLDSRPGSADFEKAWAECAALSLLEHRNIPRWEGIVNEGRGLASFYGIVETRCPGVSLERHLAARRVFDAREVHDIGMRLIGLAMHVSSRGVVHGDIRPANVLLDEEGRVSLVDFGLARFFDRKVASRERFQAAADDAEGVVEVLLYLLYSDPRRVRSREAGETWQRQLALSEAQRSFLSDGFFNKESFSSFEQFALRFDHAFSEDSRCWR